LEIFNGDTSAYSCVGSQCEGDDGYKVVINNVGAGGVGGVGDCHDFSGSEEVVLTDAAESGTSSNVSMGRERDIFRCWAILDRIEGFSSPEGVMGKDVGLMDPERSISDTGLGGLDVASGV